MGFPVFCAAIHHPDAGQDLLFVIYNSALLWLLNLRDAETSSNAVRLSVFFTFLRPLYWKFPYPHFYRPRIIRAF